MKKTFVIFGAVVLSVLLLAGAFAYQSGNRYQSSGIDKPAVEKAIESGDYASWKALHQNSNGRMASLINEGNFYLLREMHKARESGDFEKVWEIKNKLGFQKRNGQGKGKQMNPNCPFR